MDRLDRLLDRFIPLSAFIGINVGIISIIALVVIFCVSAFSENSTPTKYESIKLGDKNTKVIVDDTTGCKYIVFNNKTLTPLYDKSGNVEGCGE